MKTILIVDDSATAKLLFRAYMPEDGDFQIHEATDLDTAIAKGVAVKPDIVVMDYNMPGQNGIEIARMMRTAGIDARYILVTANTQQAVVDAARNAGFVDIVDKPVSPEKILSMLGEIG